MPSTRLPAPTSPLARSSTPEVIPQPEGDVRPVSAAASARADPSLASVSVSPDSPPA
ncbi:hypothetical protein EVJ58_g9183 [Rhodofomes roseus]|uniref:Uncharacterized protein n=1 Tax=Rhodofomes roseus TaxID=34475 RepID=A0A4Y9XVU3_9APHY|nr:hypothetical protein EVJ58_g9183 [Rhodofomes roseus]